MSDIKGFRTTDGVVHKIDYEEGINNKPTSTSNFDNNGSDGEHPFIDTRASLDVINGTTIRLKDSEGAVVDSVTLPAATEELSGTFTAEEKQKLASIENGAEPNVQADFAQNDNTQDDFIKNKPTKTSDFINDGEGGNPFIDKSVNNLDNYTDNTELARQLGEKQHTLTAGDYIGIDETTQGGVTTTTISVNTVDTVQQAGNPIQASGVKAALDKIKLEESGNNDGKLKFTNYKGEVIQVQGGFLPDNDTVKLDANNKIALKEVHVDEDTVGGDGASSVTKLVIKALRDASGVLTLPQLRQIIEDINQEIAAIEGIGGYLTPYNFGVADPEHYYNTVEYQQVLEGATYSAEETYYVYDSVSGNYIVADPQPDAESFDNGDYYIQVNTIATIESLNKMFDANGQIVPYVEGEGTRITSDAIVYTQQGEADPSSILSIVTDEALRQITSETDPVQIWNGTRITNKFNNHTYIINNTPDTDPKIFEWVDLGQAFVATATNSSQGIVKGSATNLNVQVNADGTMFVTGLSAALGAKQDTLTAGQSVQIYTDSVDGLLKIKVVTDDSRDRSSVNPIQNKVISAVVDDIIDKVGGVKADGSLVNGTLNATVSGLNHVLATYRIYPDQWELYVGDQTFNYTATITLKESLQDSSLVGIVNDDATAFAIYGYAVKERNEQNITIWAIEAPDIPVNLKFEIYKVTEVSHTELIPPELSLVENILTVTVSDDNPSGTYNNINYRTIGYRPVVPGDVYDSSITYYVYNSVSGEYTEADPQPDETSFDSGSYYVQYSSYNTITSLQESDDIDLSQYIHQYGTYSIFAIATKGPDVSAPTEDIQYIYQNPDLVPRMDAALSYPMVHDSQQDKYSVEVNNVSYTLENFQRVVGNGQEYPITEDPNTGVQTVQIGGSTYTIDNQAIYLSDGASPENYFVPDLNNEITINGNVYRIDHYDYSTYHWVILDSNNDPVTYENGHYVIDGVNYLPRSGVFKGSENNYPIVEYDNIREVTIDSYTYEIQVGEALVSGQNIYFNQGGVFTLPAGDDELDYVLEYDKTLYQPLCLRVAEFTTTNWSDIPSTMLEVDNGKLVVHNAQVPQNRYIKLVIPDTVTYIDDNNFSGCPIQELYFIGDIQQIGTTPFDSSDIQLVMVNMAVEPTPIYPSQGPTGPTATVRFTISNTGLADLWELDVQPDDKIHGGAGDPLETIMDVLADGTTYSWEATTSEAGYYTQLGTFTVNSEDAGTEISITIDFTQSGGN